MSLALDIADELTRELTALAEGVSSGVSIRFKSTPWSAYADDPVGFVRDVLQEDVTDDVEAMLLSFRDNPVTIARSANAVGKTHGAARAIVWAFCTRHESQIFTSAAPPISNLNRLLWGEIGAVVERNPQIFQHFSVSNGMQISRNSLSYVVGVAIPSTGTPDQRKAKFSGKHAPFLYFVCDEGDAIPPEIYEAIDSCMSGGHARLLVLFNPRAQTGPIYQKERKKAAKVVELTAFNHPNVITGKDTIPGAVTREVTVRRVNAWTRALTPEEISVRDVENDQDCFLIPDFLVGCQAYADDGETIYPPLQKTWRVVEEPAFSYMVLARYPSVSAQQLISASWVDRAQANWKRYVEVFGEVPPPMARQRYAGLDVAEFGGDLNVYVEKHDDFVTRPKFWGGVDVLVTGDKSYELGVKGKVKGVYVDSTGVGAGVAPHILRKGLTAYRVMLGSGASDVPRLSDGTELGHFGTLRDQGWWSLREWLRSNENAMLPPDEELRQELLAPDYHKINEKVVKIDATSVLKTKLGRSPDRAMALVVMFCYVEVETTASLQVRTYTGEDPSRPQRMSRMSRMEKTTRP